MTLSLIHISTSNSVPKASNINAQVRTDGIVSVDVLDHVACLLYTSRCV